jgi:predicted transcriptional regulator of viral defense system
MNLHEYLKYIRQIGKRCFSLKELITDLNISKNAALNAIARLRAHGDLITPAKGLYVLVPPEHQLQGSIPAEELVPILMKYLKADYYVSLLSGAQYHGASHQKPARFQVVSNKRSKHPLDFGQVKIELIYKKNLNELPTQDVAVSTGYLKVASPELVALDLLSYSSRSGGLNHIATVLSELLEAIDADKLIELADIVKEKAWLQRLGYILEHIDTMDEKKAKNIIDKLEYYFHGKITGFIPLASELPKTGYPRIKKWMIIANTNIESDL